jgi:hypothetical protein
MDSLFGNGFLIGFPDFELDGNGFLDRFSCLEMDSLIGFPDLDRMTRHLWKMEMDS